MKVAAVLGAGNWGTVVAMLASKNCERVFLYDHQPERAQEMAKLRENKRYLPGIKLPDNIQLTSSLEEVFSNCKFVVPVIPSSVFRGFVQKFASLAKGDHYLVHGTKGLEPVIYKRMSEILIEETGCIRVGSLSGPNLALEIAQGQPAATVVASRFNEVIDAAIEVFHSPQFRVYGNNDLVGVEWSGALKNIIAIGSGILGGMGFGQNAVAMLVTRGVAEISRLVEAVGGEQSTLLGLAGVGDILATSTSRLSRNYRAGELLAKNKNLQDVLNELQMTTEGVHTVKVAHTLAVAKRIEAPITAALHMLLYENRTTNEALSALMDRPGRFE